jgi:hypothetical protein
MEKFMDIDIILLTKTLLTHELVKYGLVIKSIEYHAFGEGQVYEITTMCGIKDPYKTDFNLRLRQGLEHLSMLRWNFILVENGDDSHQTHIIAVLSA